MKVIKFTPNEKVVEFTQSEKQFRYDQPVSNDVRNMIEEVHRDFRKYMVEQYLDEVLPIVKEFIEDLHPREEKRKALENNLFWWKILYDSSHQADEWSFADEFIAENDRRFMDKPLIVSWLREWGKATTKFYYVGYKYNDRVFSVIDILEDKMLNVIVKDPNAVLPEQGEIVAGTLISYGGGLFSPITDFYRFDYEAREVMGGTFRYYYDKYLKSNSLSSAFIHVLSIMLEIERRIYLKIKRIK